MPEGITWDYDDEGGTCSEDTYPSWSYSSVVCNRPAKGWILPFGHPPARRACGVHIRAQRKREESDAAWRAKYEERSLRAEIRAAALEALLDLPMDTPLKDALPMLRTLLPDLKM